MKPSLLDPEPTEPQALAPMQPAPVVNMFERLASDPNVDVAKLEKLIEMQERIIAHNARSAFNTAFAEMQGEIPAIVERAKTNNGTYAPLEDIQDAVRPILKRHGFSISFCTEWPDPKTVKVIGILTHREGHERRSEFLSGADASGNKNAIQGLGSAVSYGRRYTTKDLLNITTRGADDDGYAAGKQAPQEPDGYEDWLMDMAALADEGSDRLQVAFKTSKREYREYVTKHDAVKWAKLKAKAASVK